MTEEDIAAIKAELEAQRIEDPENVAEPQEFSGYGRGDN